MASVIHENGRLMLELSRIEQLGAFHGSPSIEESALVRKYEIKNIWNAKDLRGVRAPGTGIPLSSCLELSGIEVAKISVRSMDVIP